MSTVSSSELSRATELAARVLHERTGMDELLALDTETMSEVVDSLDGLIIAYNRLGPTFPGLGHVCRLKRDLPQLPTCRQLLDRAPTGIHLEYYRAVRTMNQHMQRAEQRQAEPNLGFALWQVSPKARALGGISHAYALTLAHEHLSGTEDTTINDWKNGLLDALLEVSVLEHSENRDTLLFALAKQQGWFNATAADGRPLFSDAVRALTEED